jgi:hypothetical protein
MISVEGGCHIGFAGGGVLRVYDWLLITSSLSHMSVSAMVPSSDAAPWSARPSPPLRTTRLLIPEYPGFASKFTACNDSLSHAGT